MSKDYPGTGKEEHLRGRWRPSGAEAAIVLAKRGHKVTVFEKEDRLRAACVRTAAVPP
ncbi:MAG: NAD-binding protein [[Clostridium] scindens]